MSEVKIMKLVNGDEIISEIEIKDNKITLSSPAKLLMFPSEDGGMGTGLMPWNPYSDKDEFVIDIEYVIVFIDPPTDLRNGYSNQFGSGIEIIEDNPGGLIL